MSDEESQPEGNVSDGINAVANLAKAVPVYDDAVKPLAIETGKALGTLGRTVNAALLPIRGVVWGFEKIEDWVATSVAKKLENVAPEDIVAPDLSIAGPTIEALKFNGHKEELSEMFAGLLATSMDKNKLESAHPSFAAIIPSLSAFDAMVVTAIYNNGATASAIISMKNHKSNARSEALRHFSPELYSQCRVNNSDDMDRFHASIDNLVRLGLADVDYSQYLSDTARYQHIEQHVLVSELQKSLNSKVGEARKVHIKKGIIEMTMLGKNFAAACKL